MIRILLRGILKISLIPLLVIAFLLLGNIYTYERLIDEKPIAKLTFSFVNEHEYDATLRLENNCDEKIYRIYGNEWRIDAQFLKWKSWATLFGLNAMYRIERLSGRYSEIQDENSKHHSAHEVTPISTLDLSRLTERYNRKLPFVDTVYGSSAYEKMMAETIFTVYRTQSGILIRKQALSTDTHQNNCVKGQSAWKNTIMRMNQGLASILHSL